MKKSMMFFESKIDEIAVLIDNNQHYEALQQISLLIGHKELAEKFKLVQQLQDLEGHLPEHLANYRADLRRQMISSAKTLCTPVAFEMLQRVF